MTDVSASFVVEGGAARDVVVEDGLTIAEIATRVYDEAEGVDLCHQCGRKVSDLQLGDLTQLTVDGKTWVPDDKGGWVEWTP